jgi:hypothetical protein
MLRILLTSALILFFSSCVENHILLDTGKPIPKALSTQIISKIAIPVREVGYSNFKTEVIKSEKEFNAFIAKVKEQKGWNKKENFLDSLRLKKINFNNYALLLYRITESSGSTILAVDAPKGVGSNIFIKIGRDKPNVGTADMAYYTLAYKVAKTVQNITFDNGIKKDVIKIASEKEYSRDQDVPKNCMEWFDGCNSCGRVGTEGIPVCTELACPSYRAFKCTKWKE